jgi:hypothetical protein
MSRITVNLREDQIQKIQRRAAKQQLETGEYISRSEIVRESLDTAFSLSSLSISALTQVAKDNGFNNLNEAVEHLVRNGGQQ